MTKYEKIRKEKIASYNPEKDCGARGRIFELECARPTSRKTGVSPAGKKDNWIIFNGRNASAENKTNGGRIESLLDGTNKSRFIVYRLDIWVKLPATKKLPERQEHRFIPPVVVPTDIFLQCLKETGAIKDMRHNGQWDGYGIQCSSKKLYERLLKWEVKFDPARNYTSADFEGLTL